MEKFRVGILGATGIVGQQFINFLHNHDYFELVALAASEKSVGKKYSDAVDWFIRGDIPKSVKSEEVIETKLAEILKKDVEIIFSALPSNVAREIEQSLAKEGVYVFSNAAAHRMDKEVPILIPEINPTHLNIVSYQDYDGGFIVTNSNCSTSGLVFGLKPLMEFGIISVFVTTYQALSGAGRGGVYSLDILGNVIPYINGEEEKIERETKKILGEFVNGRINDAQFYVNASCARVPVKDGHLESVVIELKEEITKEQAQKAFNDFSGNLENQKLPTAPVKPVRVVNDNDRPQPARDLSALDQNAVLGMPITIGRIRKKDNLLNFFLLVHNTIRGAAGASVLNAEFAQIKGFLK